MKITILAVGKVKSGPETELAQKYIKRLPWQTEIVEVEEKKPLPAQERLESEGRKLLNAIPRNSFVMALDRQGQKYSSPELAKYLQGRQSAGNSHVVLVIGGADGLSQSVLDSANHLISFGAMTWPHQLARVMLLEQLYRSHAILSGHPYHK